MNDVFNEQLIARQPNKKDFLKKVGIIIAGVVLILVAMMIEAITAFILPIIIIIGFLVFHFNRRLNLEFEYIFTNGDLDVDKILYKTKRKHVLSVNVKDFITMVPLSNKEYEHEVSRYTKFYDFSSGTINENTYGVIYEHGKERIKLIIEPNEQLFKAIKAYIPRVIKK